MHVQVELKYKQTETKANLMAANWIVQIVWVMEKHYTE